MRLLGALLRRLAIAGWISVRMIVERRVARFVLDTIHNAVRGSDAELLDLAIRGTTAVEEDREQVLRNVRRVRDMLAGELRPEDVALLDRIEAACDPMSKVN